MRLAYKLEAAVATFDSQAVNRALRGLQQGDRACADVVFKALWPIVSAYCRKAVGTGAQDLAQETLMTLFRQVAGFRADGDAVAWALEIAAWECRTELRRRSRARMPVRAAPAPEIAEDDPVERIEREQLALALKESIAHLSVSDQVVVRSVLQETFPSNASAAERKRKERALTRLKNAWRALYGAH